MVRRRSTVRFYNVTPAQEDNSNVSNSRGGYSGGQVSPARPKSQTPARDSRPLFSTLLVWARCCPYHPPVLWRVLSIPAHLPGGFLPATAPRQPRTRTDGQACYGEQPEFFRHTRKEPPARRSERDGIALSPRRYGWSEGGGQARSNPRARR